MRSAEAVRRRAAVGVVVLVIGLGGCAGHGRVEVIALNYRSIDPPAPRVGRLKVRCCHWWEDAQGRVWIALTHERPSLLGRYARFSFDMSLMVEELPAGKARNYRVGKEALRAVVRFGPAESRYESRAGIVALYQESGDRLRGSYRLRVQRQVNRLLGGWGKRANYLMQGTFVAVRDAERGSAIVSETDAQGWERESVPAAQPRGSGD